MDLVIMAAGMGSRFGGLKQIEPIDEEGNFIIDYSIFDAIRCGFDRVVFIIKKENYDIFKETVGKRVESRIKTEYVFQEMNDIPSGYTVPEGRVKPWGTGQAIYACKDVVKSGFAIINADDFYGYDAFRVVGEFLRSNNNSNAYAMAGYMVKNTLTENGSVKRGVAATENGFLTSIIESSVERVQDKIVASPLNGTTPFEVDEEAPVSMNMFAFTPYIFDRLEREFPEFMETVKDNPLKAEFLIPEVVSNQINEGEATVEVLTTTAVWQGVTYKEDKEMVVAGIKALVDEGVYPKGLWK